MSPSPSTRTSTTTSNNNLPTAAAASTTTTTPSYRSSSRRCRGLLTMLLLATLLGLSSSASLLDKLSFPKSRELETCENNNVVSAICYHCASLHPQNFALIHKACCQEDGDLRQLCEDWYTEEPKRGRRDMWYY